MVLADLQKFQRIDKVMFAKNHTIENVDSEVWQAIKGEVRRQEEYIELIASENYATRPSWKRKVLY